MNPKVNIINKKPSGLTLDEIIIKKENLLVTVKNMLNNFEKETNTKIYEMKAKRFSGDEMDVYLNIVNPLNKKT